MTDKAFYSSSNFYQTFHIAIQTSKMLRGNFRPFLLWDFANLGFFSGYATSHSQVRSATCCERSRKKSFFLFLFIVLLYPSASMKPQLFSWHGTKLLRYYSTMIAICPGPGRKAPKSIWCWCTVLLLQTQHSNFSQRVTFFSYPFKEQCYCIVEHPLHSLL